MLDNWVIVDVEGVLGDILGTIFAPDGFFIEEFGLSKGMLSYSRIRSLFGSTYGVEVVVTILKELKLGVLMNNNSYEYVQIPALLRGIDMKQSIIEDNRVYQQYAGLRFLLKSKTDIFSDSSFPKLQVTMLQKCCSKVQLWTHGICCVINNIHVIIYMAEEKTYIDIIVRSESINEKGCFLAREEVRQIIEDELQESSSGSDYCKQLIRPDNLRNCSISNDFITYDFREVLEHYRRNELSVTPDGYHTDSVEELLFCNYFEIEGR